MKKNICIFVLFNICALCVAQSKVGWIHGLNSDEYFWYRYSHEIVPKANQGPCPYWQSGNAISSIATVMDTAHFADKSTRYILVGHSAGGLVARDIQQQDNNIKAVITAGTPNNGAGIAQSLYSGSYSNIFNTVVNKADRTISYTVTAAANCAPPVSYIVSPLSFFMRHTGKNLISIGELIISAYIENNFIKSYRSNQTVNDMRPNSAYIRSLNAKSVSVPILSIYGAEYTWPVLRLLATTNGYNEYYYFSYVYRIDDIVDRSCSIHDDVYDALRWPAIVMPWIWATRELLSKSESNWRDVSNYVNYDLHNQYSDMIGAYHYETRTYTTGWWIFKRTRTETVKVYDDHDGMITSKDAILNKTNVQNVRVEGVNHMEMNSHSSMGTILENALRKGTYGKEFTYSTR